ncbi:MAG: tetratricopeptide repeat protein, partial [Deferribacterales bacterium]
MKRFSIIIILLSLLFIKPSFGSEIFDLESYELMYKSFIYTNDLNSAYAITKEALKIAPTNLEWRKRLAQLLLWLGKTREAYESYLNIYYETKDPLIEKMLLGFSYPEAIQLKIKRYKEEIENHNYRNALNLAWLYEYEGYPEKSFELLKRVYDITKDKKYLDESIKYAVKLNYSEVLIKYADHLKELSLENKYIVAYFLITKGNYKEALEILRLV